MRTNRALTSALLVAMVAGSALWARPSSAQTPMKGMMGDPTHMPDMQGFHYLLEHRAKITRSVRNLPNGIETVTESEDAEVATQLRVHVAAMAKRMEEGRPIHARDPFFAEMFRHAKLVAIKVERLPAGVRVVETSEDPYTVTLLHEHAKIVNLFLENGMAEMHKNHEVPKKP